MITQIDHAGSLVTGGETGRMTAYHGLKVRPAGWWDDFWRRHQRNTGETPGQAQARLRNLLGTGYQHEAVDEAYLDAVLK